MREDLLDHRLLEDRSDDLQFAAAVRPAAAAPTVPSTAACVALSGVSLTAGIAGLAVSFDIAWECLLSVAQLGAVKRILQIAF